MSIVYTVEVSDPIRGLVMGSPTSFYPTIFEALSYGLYIVEEFEQLHGKEIIFSESEPITQGDKENSLQIWKGYIDGVSEPLYVQLNIEKHDGKTPLAVAEIPSAKLTDEQIVFMAELEGLLQAADDNQDLFSH